MSFKLLNAVGKKFRALINGKSYEDVESVQIIINGRVVDTLNSYNGMRIYLTGDLDSLQTTSAGVHVAGNVDSVSTTSGDVEVHGYATEITTTSGDVRITETCPGLSVKTTSGDVLIGRG